MKKKNLVSVIKGWLNGGATYIIGELLAKDNINIGNLMPTFENLIGIVGIVGMYRYSSGSILAKY